MLNKSINFLKKTKNISYIYYTLKLKLMMQLYHGKYYKQILEERADNAEVENGIKL